VPVIVNCVTLAAFEKAIKLTNALRLSVIGSAAATRIEGGRAMATSGQIHTRAESGSAMPPNPPRLFILSDVRLVCEGLVLALSRDPTVLVVGASELSVPPMQIAERLPDILLLDAANLTSLEVCLPFRQVLPDVKIVAFALAEADEDVIACAEAGVSGFVSRKESVEDLVAAVHRAVRHELLCSPRTTAALFRRIALLPRKHGATAADAALTRREHEVVGLLEQGLSNKEIARLLRIESATVKNHVHAILAKLQVRRRGEAAAKVRQTDTHRVRAVF
jgi:DNA-binding NarL/FixJ family response regulator